jgi:predicted GNAT family N-acyltransferase
VGAEGWRESGSELYELLRFRQTIFVVEQRSPYPDLHGLDQKAWHLVARGESELAGYLHLMPIAGPPPLVRIGRVAVSSHLRRHGIGRTLMEEALLFCRKCYAGQPIAHSAAPPLAKESLTQNQGDFAVRAYRRFEEQRGVIPAKRWLRE